MFGLAGSVLASWEQTPPLPVALNNGSNHSRGPSGM